MSLTTARLILLTSYKTLQTVPNTITVQIHPDNTRRNVHTQICSHLLHRDVKGSKWLAVEKDQNHKLHVSYSIASKFHSIDISSHCSSKIDNFKGSEIH